MGTFCRYPSFCCCDIKYKNFWSFAHINCTYFKYLECVCAEGEMLHEICHALLWKCLGPQFLICFYYPVNIYNVGGLPYPAIIELRRQIKKSSILLFNIWKLNTWTLATICLWLLTQFLNLFYLVACNCLQPIKCYVRGNFENPHCVEVCVK